MTFNVTIGIIISTGHKFDKWMTLLFLDCLVVDIYLDDVTNRAVIFFDSILLFLLLSINPAVRLGSQLYSR